VAPGVGGESAPFVGSQHSKCHGQGQSIIHSLVTYLTSIGVQAGHGWR
jgi:hypothetical protein